MYHRKRALIRRLPKNCDITYYEPFRLGKKWSWYQDGNIKVRTIFCYKKGLDKLFGFLLVRRIVSSFNFAFVRAGILLSRRRADVAIVSNHCVFDLRRLRLLASRVVVDINDIPGGFGVPDWVESNFLETVEGADKVIVAAREWKRFREDAIFIPNGVEYETFNLRRHNRGLDGH